MKRRAYYLPIAIALAAAVFLGLTYHADATAPKAVRVTNASILCNNTYAIKLWIQDNTGIQTEGVGNDLLWEPNFEYIKFLCTGDHVMLQTPGHNQCLKATTGSLLVTSPLKCYAGDKLEMWRLFFDNPPGQNATRFFLRSDALDPDYLGDWGPFPTRGNHKVHESPQQTDFATGLELQQ